MLIRFKIISLILITALILAVAGSGLVQAASQDRTIGRKSKKPAEPRHALVIGNSAYDSAPLKNPVNDAEAMARTLREVGFKVIKKTNLDQRRMKRAINDFGRKIRAGGVALFYFAGHGMQVDGRNYLIPVKAVVEAEEDVELEAVDAGRVMAKMEAAGTRVNLVILDACRNNPFARSFRSANQGLAHMDAPSGTLIAYATAPGSVASDGSGENGLYTQELIRQLRVPNRPVEEVFKRVRAQVMKLSGERQTPWESSSLVGNFYFGGKEPKVASAAPPPKQEPIRPQIVSKKKRTGRVTIRSNVDGAKFDLAGARFTTEAGSEYTVGRVPVGRHRIKATLKGYKTWHGTLTVRAGEEALLDIRMSPTGKRKAKKPQKPKKQNQGWGVTQSPQIKRKTDGTYFTDPVYGFRVKVPFSYSRKAFEDGTDRVLELHSEDNNLFVQFRAFKANANVTTAKILTAVEQMLVKNLFKSGWENIQSAQDTVHSYRGYVKAYRAEMKSNGVRIITAVFATIQRGVGYLIWAVVPESLYDARHAEADAIVESFRIGG